MKVSTIKSVLGSGLVGAAVLLMTACGGGQPTAASVVAAAQAEPAVFVAPDAGTKITAASQQGTDMSDIPTGSPAVYAEKSEAQRLHTRLNQETHLANIRSGPGVEFEIIGTVDQETDLVAAGRTENGDWLQIEHQGQVGWLAGRLVIHQSLTGMLPVVNTADLVPEPVEAEAGEAEAEESVTTTAGPVSEAEEETQILNRLEALTCAAAPIRGFGQVWKNHPEVRPLLGCPFTNFRRDEHATNAAVQSFERGWMLWLETDTVQNVDPIYIFFADDSSYIRFGDRDLVDAHSYALTPPGFYKVGDRFAKVYREELDWKQRARLGHAINEARDSQGAFQEFENGRMFWSGQADTIYVIYEGHYDFDGDGQFTRLRGWKSYEDTFEASTTDQ